MNLARVKAVAMKDLEEFRRNKYVIITIVLMPIMISVVLPAVYVLPINQLTRQSTSELDLAFEIAHEISNASVTDAILFDTRFYGVTLENCILKRCIIENSTIRNSSLSESRVVRSSTEYTMLIRCELVELTADVGNTVRECNYIGGNPEVERLREVMFNVLLILLVMIPVTIPTVTASYSFVGEKVNKSLEPLLATPISDLELLAGKAGSIFVLSMGATWLSFVVAVTMVDLLTEPVLGYYPLPNAYWIAGMLLLAPGMCLMSILGNVLISSRVNDVRVSQQIGGVVVLPVLVFFLMSLTGALSSALLPLLVFSGAVFAVDAAILWLSLAVFKREEILVNWR